MAILSIYSLPALKKLSSEIDLNKFQIQTFDKMLKNVQLHIMQKTKHIVISQSPKYVVYRSISVQGQSHMLKHDVYFTISNTYMYRIISIERYIQSNIKAPSMCYLLESEKNMSITSSHVRFCNQTNKNTKSRPEMS